MKPTIENNTYNPEYISNKFIKMILENPKGSLKKEKIKPVLFYQTFSTLNGTNISSQYCELHRCPHKALYEHQYYLHKLDFSKYVEDCIFNPAYHKLDKIHLEIPRDISEDRFTVLN